MPTLPEYIADADRLILITADLAWVFFFIEIAVVMHVIWTLIQNAT